LDPIALAYWYMDDGSFSGDLTLNTQNFSLVENRLLQQALGRNFGLKVSIHKDNRKTAPKGALANSVGAGTLYRLYICAESRDDFFRIVSPYMHSNFEYKLPEEYVFIGPRLKEFHGICK
jgi:hypothetical protein